MTIYSIYYYTQKKKLDQSIVADAKDLPNTTIGIDKKAAPGKNIIYTQGLAQVIPAIHLKSDSFYFLAPAPAEHFVFFNDLNTSANREKFYEGLVTKFPNHPPLLFKDAKDGDRVLLSYFFYNVRLPQG